MTATQPTFNEVFDMACMLPRQEQQELVQKVQYIIRLNATSSPISKEELLTRLEHADAYAYRFIPGLPAAGLFRPSPRRDIGAVGAPVVIRAYFAGDSGFGGAVSLAAYARGI